MRPNPSLAQTPQGCYRRSMNQCESDMRPATKTIQPTDLPKVAKQHHRGIFGNFREVVGQRIAELRERGNSSNLETARFFEYLLAEVKDEEYSAIQRHYLTDGNIDPKSDLAKYLDPVIWFESKMRIARKLELDKRPPLRVLDLGTGPGHFPVVARFYGHDVTGTDLPQRSKGIDQTGHLYDALCNIYRVRRISHTIRPMESVGNVGGPFDLITAFLAAFNVDEAKKPWTVEHWRYFLISLKRDALAADGILFMTLADQKLTSESWAFLKSVAEHSEEKSKQILVSNFTFAF